MDRYSIASLYNQTNDISRIFLRAGDRYWILEIDQRAAIMESTEFTIRLDVQEREQQRQYPNIRGDDEFDDEDDDDDDRYIVPCSISCEKSRESIAGTLGLPGNSEIHSCGRYHISLVMPVRAVGILVACLDLIFDSNSHNQ